MFSNNNNNNNNEYGLINDFSELEQTVNNANLEEMTALMDRKFSTLSEVYIIAKACAAKGFVELIQRIQDKGLRRKGALRFNLKLDASEKPPLEQNSVHTIGESLLLIAVANDQFEMLKHLYNDNIRKVYSHNPYTSVVYLYLNFDYIKTQALMTAVQHGHVTMAHALLSIERARLVLNNEHFLYCLNQDKENNPMLRYIIKKMQDEINLDEFVKVKNNLAIVKLIRHGLNINSGKGLSPNILHLDSNIVKIILIEGRADMSLENKRPILVEAIRLKNIPLVKWMLENGGIFITENKRVMDAIVRANSPEIQSLIDEASYLREGSYFSVRCAVPSYLVQYQRVISSVQIVESLDHIQLDLDEQPIDSQLDMNSQVSNDAINVNALRIN